MAPSGHTPATLLATATLVLTMTVTPALAQTGVADRAQVERAQQALKDAGHDPGSIDGVMGARTSAALKAYDTKPSAADPAQAKKNAGEGAAYSRSNEKK